MGLIGKRWNDDQDKMVKILSEKGGYLFIPEGDYFSDFMEEEKTPEKQQKQEKGIVLKIEKGGKISDAVLSFGYQKTRLDKENIIGLSINDFEDMSSPFLNNLTSALSAIKEEPDKYAPKVTTTRSTKTGKLQHEVTFKKVEKYSSSSYFDFDEMREVSQKEFEKYKSVEQIRNLRYNRTLETTSDPLEEKLEYADAKRKLALKNEEQEKATAKGVFNHNYGNIDAAKRIAKLNQQRIAAKKRIRGR